MTAEDLTLEDKTTMFAIQLTSDVPRFAFPWTEQPLLLTEQEGYQLLGATARRARWPQAILHIRCSQWEALCSSGRDEDEVFLAPLGSA